MTIRTTIKQVGTRYENPLFEVYILMYGRDFGHKLDLVPKYVLAYDVGLDKFENLLSIIQAVDGIITGHSVFKWMDYYAIDIMYSIKKYRDMHYLQIP